MNRRKEIERVKELLTKRFKTQESALESAIAQVLITEETLERVVKIHGGLSVSTYLDFLENREG